MTRTSLAIGVILSLVAHAALVVVTRGGAAAPPAPVPAPKPEAVPTIVVSAPVPAPAPPTAPAPAPPPELPKLEPPLIEAVEELAPAPDVPALRDGPDLTPVAAPAPLVIDESETLPPLRITWGSPAELRAVARRLGMRIVAVDGLGEVLGEVMRNGPLRTEPFQGSFSDYSNRVRTLPRRYFGSSLTTVSNRPVSSFWILVPVALDRQMTATVRRALEAERKAPADVRWVEAGFGPGPKLVVTGIHE